MLRELHFNSVEYANYCLHQSLIESDHLSLPSPFLPSFRAVIQMYSFNGEFLQIIMEIEQEKVTELKSKD